MADVNPLILVVAGTALAGLVTVTLCMRKGKEERDEPVVKREPIVEQEKPASKPKKKSKSKAKKSASKENLQVVEDPSPVPSQHAVKHDAKLSASEVEASESSDSDGDDVFATKDMREKSKRALETIEAAKAKAELKKKTPAQKKEILEKAKEPAPVVEVKAKKEPPVPAPVTVHHAPKVVAEVSAPLFPPASSATPLSFDGWAVVEGNRKVKGKKGDSSDDEQPPKLSESTTPVVKEEPVFVSSSSTGPEIVVEEPAAPPAPVIEQVTTTLTVDAKKLGLLIGPKGVTKIGIQTATETEISMPKVEKDFAGPVEISVTGAAEGVARAVYALNELCTKGYCNMLSGPDFRESYVEVKPKYLPDIIGKGGASIRAIQQFTGVKISTPSGYTKTGPAGETIMPSKVKISLAGMNDKVVLARQLILELTKYYHTEVTHPSVTHVEMDIPSNYYNYIIGAKGSEIRHIQANFKVTVYIPNADSANQNVLIVGEETAVLNAEKYVRKLMEKVDTQQEERARALAEGIALGESAKAKFAAANAANATPAATTLGGGSNHNSRSSSNHQRREKPQATAAADADKKENEDEAWMNEFAPRKSPINFAAMLPPGKAAASNTAPSV